MVPYTLKIWLEDDGEEKEIFFCRYGKSDLDTTHIATRKGNKMWSEKGLNNFLPYIKMERQVNSRIEIVQFLRELIVAIVDKRVEGLEYLLRKDGTFTSDERFSSLIRDHIYNMWSNNKILETYGYGKEE